ncbi:LOW QUALITY PROTEIN: hypothetical protein M8C21_027815 [Ambrosia artemisiifolia]|uniref:Uncharacterized protein n=1 Tax=Ambrosia artemisiifolia TaxID=4212 RepID=A0AAD5CJB8_AMBAR|nr:LOW QUALITY PROTEIN: hypothetical protein M8C21_027815 [Ambrosia artemisiifolia]
MFGGFGFVNGYDLDLLILGCNYANYLLNPFSLLMNQSLNAAVDIAPADPIADLNMQLELLCARLEIFKILAECFSRKSHPLKDMTTNNNGKSLIEELVGLQVY